MNYNLAFIELNTNLILRRLRAQSHHTNEQEIKRNSIYRQYFAPFAIRNEPRLENSILNFRQKQKRALIANQYYIYS